MAASIDIPLESLFAKPAPAPVARVQPQSGRSFYIETFGCQMNVHDPKGRRASSFAGINGGASHGAPPPPISSSLQRHVQHSRESRAKSFFAPRQFRGALGEEKIVGVLGCLAQQEGEKIFRRAPWVRMVCGSASYRKLPEMLAELEAGGRRIALWVLPSTRKKHSKPKSRHATIPFAPI